MMNQHMTLIFMSYMLNGLLDNRWTIHILQQYLETVLQISVNFPLEFHKDEIYLQVYYHTIIHINQTRYFLNIRLTLLHINE